MYDLDVVGDDLSTVGAVQPVYTASLARQAARMPFARAVASQRPQWLGLASEQGVSLPKEELDFLPFDPVKLLEGQDAGSLSTFPQRPFRGERLIMQAFYKTAGGVTDALFSVLITPAIYVGAVQVGSTQGSTPASTFSATAFGVRLSMPTAGQGTRIVIPVSCGITIGADESVTISATLIGRAVR
jgi:hypothetical protein